MSQASQIQYMTEALRKIAAVAQEAASNGRNGADGSAGGARTREKPSCVLKTLPKKLQVKAAQTATKVNPVNRPAIGRLFSVAPQADPRLAIAVLTTKYWGPGQRQFTVSFLDSTTAEFRRRILSHMNAWSQTANVTFVETARNGQVRISLQPGGFWSYLGTDILHIPSDRQTMNLEGFSMDTPESEYHRVVRHETGHTLGFPHEHMRREIVARIDPEKAYQYFWRTQRWDRQEVDQQVLTPLDDATIFGTPPDVDSIMCYQLPGEITRDGQPIPGGLDIDSSDFEFAGRIYPKSGTGPGIGTGGAGGSGDGGDDDPGNFLEEPNLF